MPRSSFSNTGFDIGKNDRNLAYYYGLSDFWYSIFQESEKIELLLEADSISLSDIYSKFLQLASSISLEEMAITTSQQIKLVLIKSSDSVAGKTNTYKLPEIIISSRFIANRPFLPTAFLENEIHYRISDDGSEISFFEPIEMVGFSNRGLEDGSDQYALWFVDVLIDEELVYRHYGYLMAVTPNISSASFRNFIYGLFYLYSNGPNLALLRKGLNLALNIPLARELESVLEIRKYLDTDQWLVITDLNSYLIPYGLEPSVDVGDTVTATQELAQWVEVKDYINDGDWWINFQIPTTIMPFIPPGQPDRYAKKDTYADYVMRNYLYKHTFLVNVKTIDFKNIQTFQELAEIIHEVKPTYTYPIYVWTVPTKDETITLDEDFALRWDNFRCENLTLPIDKFVRLNCNYSDIGSHHSEIAVTNNELSYTGSGTGRAAKSSISMPDSRWYWEVTITASDTENVNISVGIGTSAATLASPVGTDALSVAYATPTYSGGGKKRVNNVLTSYGAAYTAGDVIGVDCNIDAGTVVFYKNGVSQGSINHSLGTSLYAMVSMGNTTAHLSLNFGAMPFAYTPPVGANGGVYTLGQMLTRGCPQFTRNSVNHWIASQFGGEPRINGTPNLYDDFGIVEGFINPINQFRRNTYRERAWYRTFIESDHESFRQYPTYHTFNANLATPYDNSGLGVREFTEFSGTKRVIYLYATTQWDLEEKFARFGSVVPSSETWAWTLFEPSFFYDEINVQVINSFTSTDSFDILRSQFDNLFFRGSGVNYLGNFMPKIGYNTYAPTVNDLAQEDYLLFIRIYETIVGVYWVTGNELVKAPAFWVAEMTDPITAQIDSFPLGVNADGTLTTGARSLGYYSSFFYLRSFNTSYHTSTSGGTGGGSGINVAGINTSGINSGGGSGTGGGGDLIITQAYTDLDNPTPIHISRNGTILKIRRDFK